MKKRRWLLAICVALVLGIVLSLGGIATFAENCNDIRDQVLRLHVLANSNSEEDQALKLTVRDAILQEAEGLLDVTANKEAAIKALEASLPRLIEVAQTCVEEQGYSYSVKAVSNECKNGRKLLIVKDSYGNALAPFLMEGFEEIYQVIEQIVEKE